MERELAALNAARRRPADPRRPRRPPTPSRRRLGPRPPQARRARSRRDRRPRLARRQRARRRSRPARRLSAHRPRDRPYADDLFNQSSAVAKRTRSDSPASGSTGTSDARRPEVGRGVAARRLAGAWADCGLVPLDPEAMEGWLDRLEELRALRARAVEHEQEGARTPRVGRSVRGSASRAAGRDRARRPHAPRRGPRAREASSGGDEQSRCDLRRDSASFRTRPTGPRRGGSSVRARRRPGPTAGEPCLQELRLPADWDAGLTGKVLRDLKSTFADLEAADGHADRIAAHEARLAEFEPRVQAIAADLAADLLDAPSRAGRREPASRD